MNNTHQQLNWIGWSSFLLSLVVGTWLITSTPSTTGVENAESASSIVEASLDRESPGWAEGIRVGHRNIEDIRVGDRVMARNPEVADTERASWTEPDWSRWLHLSLEMPKEDGSTLKIELLRPEKWFMDQVGYVLERNPMTELEQLELVIEERLNVVTTQFDYMAFLDAKPAELTSERVSLAPVRNWVHELAINRSAIEYFGGELAALTVEMDLPELGLTGAAFVTNIQSMPEINQGSGLPVTATFHHTSGEVVDLTIENHETGEQETIGTTGNHPFWSVDRQTYLQANELMNGERLQTWTNQMRYVVRKHFRKATEAVFNMEVALEHVYFVGNSGILTHNNRAYVERRLTELVDSGELEHIGYVGARANNIRRFRSTMGGYHVNFDIDAQGRTVRASGTWVDTAEAKAFRQRKQWRQSDFVSVHNSTYSGHYNAGHIFAHEAGGFWDSPNFLVMEGYFNQNGIWRTMESQLNSNYAGKRLIFEIDYARPRSFRDWTANVKSGNGVLIDSVEHIGY